MTKAFTPGPWFKNLEYVQVCLSGIGNTDVCFVSPVNINSEANARLIAAAPDLYEALQEIKNHCSRLLDLGSEEDHSFGVIEDIALAALAKVQP